MTNDEIRIAIAEECGWRYIISNFNGSGLIKGKTSDGDIVSTFYYEIPNYPNDLNAMHEAEKTLTGKEWNDYIRRLGTCQTLQDNPYIGDLWASNVVSYNLCRATSQQRAKAFLCTKSKWRAE